MHRWMVLSDQNSAQEWISINFISKWLESTILTVCQPKKNKLITLTRKSAKRPPVTARSEEQEVAWWWWGQYDEMEENFYFHDGDGVDIIMTRSLMKMYKPRQVWMKLEFLATFVLFVQLLAIPDNVMMLSLKFRLYHMIVPQRQHRVPTWWLQWPTVPKRARADYLKPLTSIAMMMTHVNV